MSAIAVTMHPRIDDPGHIRGVRTVALLEFTKGLLVVLAGMGIFSIRHKDIWGLAESFLEFFHANPNHRIVGVFIDLVYQLSNIRLWKVAVVAAVYVILRFIEAYGLWYVRAWAEWMAIASGTIYIPFEVIDLWHHPAWFRLVIVAVNVGIVLYMLALRLEAAKKHAAARHSAQS